MKKNTLRYRIWKARTGYLFILPLFIGLLMFCYYPPIYGIVLSLFEKRSFGSASFIGFENYVNLFKDDIFLNSIGTMFKIMIPKLLISVIVPLVCAELIFGVKSKKMQSAYRVLILLPIVAPGVVGTLIWRNIYDPNNGLLSTLLQGIGIIKDGQIIEWLHDPKYVIFSIIFMGFPWIGGTSVLIYMSGMMNISQEVIEASRLDGASTFRRIISIDLPLLMGQIRYFLIFGVIGGLQDYGVQVVLTEGGPGYATYVPGYYMYNQAFSFDNFGYASAIGTIMFVIIAVFSALTSRLTKTKEVY